jgi:DNA-binding CsgD family transcriptional regulator
MKRGSRPAEAVLMRRGDLELLVVDLPASPALPAALTPGERDIVTRLIEGASNREIARSRGTSERTVANQLKRIYRKLGVFSRAELVATIGDEHAEAIH